MARVLQVGRINRTPAPAVARSGVLGILAFVAGCVQAGAQAGAGPEPPQDPAMQVNTVELVREQALEDVARRTGVARERLEVLVAEAVTWPDGSLGCPEPGMAYTQALVPGFRVRIRADGPILDYHAGARGRPKFCPPDRATPPLPSDDT